MSSIFQVGNGPILWKKLHFLIGGQKQEKLVINELKLWKRLFIRFSPRGPKPFAIAQSSVDFVSFPEARKPLAEDLAL